MKIAVFQMGARMHYAIPRIFHEAGFLHRFYTDICATKGWPRLLKFIPPKLLPSFGKRLASRVPYGVPRNKIKTFGTFGLQYAFKRRSTSSLEERNTYFLWAGNSFCKKILNLGIGDATAVYTFNLAGLEILQWARGLGLTTISEQTIAPSEYFFRLLKIEHENFPDWGNQLPNNPIFNDISNREMEEWKLTDFIICPSEFVKREVANCGGPLDRCYVVPYGLNLPPISASKRSHDGPLRVLTVGEVGLRKGSPYVLEAARQMKGKAEFRMVGAVNVLPKARKLLSECVELLGIVPRSEVKMHYEWADVFLLPSLCEGSAIVTYEAMDYSLPVVATLNTGSIVRDGIDGFIVPMRNSNIIAEKLASLADNPDLLLKMSEMAKARTKDISIDAYGKRLLSVISNIA